MKRSAGSLLHCGALLIAAAWTARAAPIPENRPSPDVHALVGARVVVAPGRAIAKGTIVVREGRITAVGADVPVPPDARVWDLEGRTVTAGFIDPHVPFGNLFGGGREPSPRPARRPRPDACDCDEGLAHAAAGGPPEPRETAPEALLRAAFRAADALPPRFEAFRAHWKAGIAAVLVVPQAGAARGASCAVNLAPGESSRRILRQRVFQHFAFETRRGAYPASLMGSVAFLRQALLDRDWQDVCHRLYARDPKGLPPPRTEPSVLGLIETRDLPAAFLCRSPLDAFRAVDLARAFALEPILVTGPEIRRRLDAVNGLGAPLILRLDFPPVPRVDSDDAWEEVTLETLREWHHAPALPAGLAAAGARVAFTADGLREPDEWLSRIRAAVKRGLPEEAALAAVTTSPAALLGLSASLGTVEVGKLANLAVWEEGPFAPKGRVRGIWVAGEPFSVGDDDPDPAGLWRFDVAPEDPDGRGSPRTIRVEIRGKPGYLEVRLPDAADAAASEGGEMAAAFSSGHLSLRLPGRLAGANGPIRLEGIVSGDACSGVAFLDGRRLAFSAAREAPPRPGEEETDSGTAPGIPETPDRGPLAHARETLIRNAVVWTCGPQGTLPGTDVLVRDGKIAAIGRGLAAGPDAAVVDAAGRHLTPGLIDAHSHAAIEGGGNEATDSCTAEVRIADVIDADRHVLYEQLASGVTTIHLMHGSANTIGGQGVVVKLRWGGLPQDLLLDGAPPVIKFALGENPKRSAGRFPRTRLGIEQFIRERFAAARAYRAEQSAYESLSEEARGDRYPPRRDLTLEALAEILEGKRVIHCHAYRQDEILMLMRLAESMGFRVGTFHHALEGYKVADAIARHGAGAATFTDWWAFKMEAYDAIPHNGALLFRAGVCTSFKSDSARLARHLNREAAKAIRYGGLSEEEALRFVTAHPARQLGIDGRVGILAVGKDADLALWSGNPLAPFTVCEKTWVDGLLYFDRGHDRERTVALAREREALVARARAAGERAGGRKRDREAVDDD